jgi:hypothetical protein
MRHNVKTPLVLVAASTLIVTPSFSETIALHPRAPSGGRILKGEILEVTTDHVMLKTFAEKMSSEGEVVEVTEEHVIPLCDIAKVEGGEERLSMLLEAATEGALAAEVHVNRAKWTFAGCVLSVAGVELASATYPGAPPQTYLMGKSPEYSDAFLSAFVRRSRQVQRSAAVNGCIVGSLVMAAGGCAFCFWAVNRSAELMLEDILSGCLVSSGSQ